MSVLSRTRTPRTQKQVDIPQPRTSAPGTAPATESRGIPRLALVAAGVVAAAAVGTAVWTVVDDDPSPAAPNVAPGVLAPGDVGAEQDVLSERIARELQRDNARAGTFAG